MFSNHPANIALTKLGAFNKKPLVKAVLDSVADKKTDEEVKQDKVFDAADAFTDQQMRIDVAAAVMEWVETSATDLDEGESMADRLFALVLGIADENKDGDIIDAEEAVATMALETALSYMIGKGVSEADALAVLNDGDDEAAGRVSEFLKGEMPDGEEASMDDVDSFAFDSESSSDLFDCVLDAVYRKKVVVRGGKKMRINRRVSGRVVLSAAQKMGIRKARRKANSSVAKMRRKKSMRIRARSGL